MRTRQPLAALLLSVVVASPVIASFGLPDEPAPRFVAVPDGFASPAPDLVLRSDDRVGRDGRVPDVRVLAPVFVHTRPRVAVPSPRLIVVKVDPGPLGTGSGTPSRGAGTNRVAGRASWYDDGPGLYAAAGPALRVGAWRGRTVVVRAGTHEVRLRLTDWCQCYFRTDHERAIDLSPEAFRRLAPLGRGIVKVTISW